MAVADFFSDRRGLKKGGVTLISLMAAALKEQSMQEPMKPGDLVRASGVGYLCARQEVLLSQNGVVQERKLTADTAVTYAYGHGVHFAFQNHLIPATGALVGVWFCLRCGETYGRYSPECTRFMADSTLVPRPDGCVRCQGDSDSFIYREPFLVDIVARFKGHPDGFLVLPTHEGVGLVEFKSINERSFADAKKAPLQEHVLQVHGYFWLTGLTWARIVYWNKAGNGMSSLAEHLVTRDEDLVNVVQRRVLSIRDGLLTGVVPEHRICESPICPTAVACPVQALCFNLVTPS